MYVTLTPSSSKSSLGKTSNDSGFLENSSPLGFAGGQSNLTEYVGNSPTNATDPTGLVAVDDGSDGSAYTGNSDVDAEAVGLMTTDGGSGGGTPVFGGGSNLAGGYGGVSLEELGLAVGGSNGIILLAKEVPTIRPGGRLVWILGPDRSSWWIVEEPDGYGGTSISAQKQNSDGTFDGPQYYAPPYGWTPPIPKPPAAAPATPPATQPPPRSTPPKAAVPTPPPPALEEPLLPGPAGKAGTGQEPPPPLPMPRLEPINPQPPIDWKTFFEQFGSGVALDPNWQIDPELRALMDPQQRYPSWIPKKLYPTLDQLQKAAEIYNKVHPDNPVKVNPETGRLELVVPKTITGGTSF
jgi:hypothetical protein